MIYPYLNFLKSYIGYKTELKPFVKPFSLALAVTKNCNLRCKMCQSRLNTRKNELTLKEIEKILKAKTLKNLVFLLLTGGEPFLRDDISDIAVVAHESIPHLDDFRIATNGTFPEKIISTISEILSKTNLSISIKISVDGLETIHDSIRRVPGTFSKLISTLNGLKDLRKENNRLHLSVSFTAMDENIDEIWKVYERFGKEVEFFFKPGQNYSSNLKDKTKLLISEKTQNSLLKFIDFFITKEFENKKGISGSAQKLFYEYMRKFIEQPSRRPIPCSAGYSSFFIDSDGSVYTCGLAISKIGNVRKSSLDQIWHSSLAKKARKRVKKGKCTCYTSCDLVPSIITCRWYKAVIDYLKVRRQVRKNK